MKRRKPRKRIIFDNYDVFEQYEESAKEALKEELEEGQEPTDSQIADYCYECSESDWDDAYCDLKGFFDDGSYWIITGTIGRWNGTFAGGTIFRTFDEMFSKATCDCDYWSIYDENGHLYLKCSHHDGTNFFEIRRLTERGVAYYENWNYSCVKNLSEREIHKRIIDSYSRLPNFAHTVYGCLKIDNEAIA